MDVFTSILSSCRKRLNLDFLWGTTVGRVRNSTVSVNSENYTMRNINLIAQINITLGNNRFLFVKFNVNKKMAAIFDPFKIMV